VLGVGLRQVRPVTDRTGVCLSVIDLASETLLSQLQKHEAGSSGYLLRSLLCWRCSDAEQRFTQRASGI